VSPYRAPSAETRTFDIGSRADFHTRVALAGGLLVIAVAAVGVAARFGSGVAPLAVSCVLGAIFLLRTRHCRIEVSRAEREVRVVVTRVGPTVRGVLSFAELEGVHVAPANMRVQNPDYVLQVGSLHGKAITLLEAKTEAELRAERDRVERFLVEAGALPERAGP